MTVPFFLVLLLLLYLLTLLQSTWISEMIPHFMKPDLMLIFVVYVGTLPYLISGAAVVAIGGLLYELFSGCPGGLFVVIYLLLFFLLKFLAKFILIGESLSFRLLLVFAALFLQDLLVGLLPFAFGILQSLFFPRWTWILSQAAATSLVGWPLWILFKKVETLPRMIPPPKSA
jgi:hypothetical protein